MRSKRLTIQNKLGLHARAASVFVKTASAFGATIGVRNDAGQANGKSIMSMMMLQASFGTEIDVSVEGEDETEAMAAIEAIIDNKFGEAE